MNITVTGANGFVGSNLVTYLDRRGFDVTAVIRQDSKLKVGPNTRISKVKSLDEPEAFRQILKLSDVVVHCAGISKASKIGVSDSVIDQLRAVNVAGTTSVATVAGFSGVKHFILLSSAKVNGESTPLGSPFSAKSVPCPESDYGKSKYESEIELEALCRSFGMAFTIIRPPLVYGRGAGGNILSLAKLVSRGVPLPFGSVENKRSLISISNLMGFIERCILNGDSRNKIFLVSDDDDISTPDLIRRIGVAIGTRPLLVKVSPTAINICARLLGLNEFTTRLLGSLQLDITESKQTLAWAATECGKVDLERMLRNYD